MLFRVHTGYLRRTVLRYVREDDVNNKTKRKLRDDEVSSSRGMEYMNSMVEWWWWWSEGGRRRHKRTQYCRGMIEIGESPDERPS